MAEKKNTPLDPVLRAFLDDDLVHESPESLSDTPSNEDKEAAPAEVPATE